MAPNLEGLKIDRDQRRPPEPSKWAARWIIGGVALLVLLGIGRFALKALNAAPEVETVRVSAPAAGGDPGSVVLNATGYIVAHHEIELASKVNGKVEWIGVEKGNAVKKGQVLVRLEDTEYRAQLEQWRGNLLNL